MAVKVLSFLAAGASRRSRVCRVAVDSRAEVAVSSNLVAAKVVDCRVRAEADNLDSQAVAANSVESAEVAVHRTMCVRVLQAVPVGA